VSGNYWPTTEVERLLEAALLPGEAGLASWRRAQATIDPDRQDEASRGLLPLVYGNIVGLDATSPRMDVLEEQYKITWRRNQQLFGDVCPVLQAFERAGIDAIILKGLALVARYYHDPGLRPMADVDLLVPPSAVERASSVLRERGWIPWYRLNPAFLRVKHALPFDNQLGTICDLHWRIFEEPADRAADDEVRAGAVTVSFQGERLRILSPTDQLLHVCGHGARWAQVPGIRWVADAVLILREGQLDWRRLVEQAVRRRFVLRMREMLVYLRTAFGAPVPASVIAELANRSVSALERFEYRIRNREHRLLGELPTYVCNCFRIEPRPFRALPGYLQQAWGLDSLREVPRHALTRAMRRLRMTLTGAPR
jgi:hypothetical protein